MTPDDQIPYSAPPEWETQRVRSAIERHKDRENARNPVPKPKEQE